MSRSVSSTLPSCMSLGCTNRMSSSMPSCLSSAAHTSPSKSRARHQAVALGLPVEFVVAMATWIGMRAEELSRAVPAGRHDPPVDPQIELRPLRYFVAVAEELHFGRAAERLYMSQSPLSRAIRELERDLGLVLFRRTTRQVELTPAGAALLERARRALAEVELGVEDARRAARPRDGRAIGHGPLSRELAARVGAALGRARTCSARRGRLAGAAAAGRRARARRRGRARDAGGGRRDGVRVDALRDEPLLAALPRPTAYADAGRSRSGPLRRSA